MRLNLFSTTAFLYGPYSVLGRAPAFDNAGAGTAFMLMGPHPRLFKPVATPLRDKGRSRLACDVIREVETFSITGE